MTLAENTKNRDIDWQHRRIPGTSHWPHYKFGDLFEFIRNGMNVRQDKSGNGLPITRIETIADGTVDLQRVGYAGLHKDECENWLLSPGDILFSHINSFDQVGKCAVYQGSPRELVHGMNLLCLRCDKRVADPGYIKYLLRSGGFRVKLQPFINKAVNQASVSIGNLKSIPLRLPPLPEQRRIATILDKADELRTKRRESLAQIDSLAQSIFLVMFGHPARNDKGWPTKRLRDVAATCSGGTPDRSAQELYGGSIPWVKSGELVGDTITRTKETLTPGGLKFSSAKLMPKGTVLVAMYGATAGQVSTLGIEAATNQAVCCIQTGSDILSEYLVPLLRVIMPSFLEKRVGGAQPNLSQGMIRELLLPLPPLSKQQVFSDRLRETQRLGNDAVLAGDHLNNLFASLQHRAFRGEL